MMHTMEAERPLGGRERLPKTILWVYTRGSTGQGLGAQGRAASLAGVEVESAGEEPRGLWLRRQYAAVPERHLPDSSWLLLVFIPRWTR